MCLKSSKHICVKMNLETIKHKLMTPQQDDLNDLNDLKKSMINHGYKLWLTHFKGDKPAKIAETATEKPLVLINSK